MAVDQDDWLGESIRRCRPAANCKIVETGYASFGGYFRIATSSTFGSPWKTMRERLQSLATAIHSKYHEEMYYVRYLSRTVVDFDVDDVENRFSKV